MPSARETALTREWVRRWQRAGPALEAVRRAEVAALTDERALAATLDLQSMLDVLPTLPPRPGSGLVEQQRLFARARGA